MRFGWNRERNNFVLDYFFNHELWTNLSSERGWLELQYSVQWLPSFVCKFIHCLICQTHFNPTIKPYFLPLLYPFPHLLSHFPALLHLIYHNFLILLLFLLSSAPLSSNTHTQSLDLFRPFLFPPPSSHPKRSCSWTLVFCPVLAGGPCASRWDCEGWFYS